MRQGAVVGEEERTFDVGVEAPHRIEPHVTGHEVRDDGASVRIPHRGDVTPGLVEQEVAERLGTRQRRAVDRDEIDRGIGQRREVADDRAVDRDAALGDEALSSPS